MRVLAVSFEVTEDKAGSILADLADRVSSLSFGLVVPVAHDKNRPRTLHAAEAGKAATAEERLLEIIRSASRPLMARDCAVAWSHLGHRPRSMYTALSRLIRKKKLRRRGKLKSRNATYEVLR